MPSDTISFFVRSAKQDVASANKRKNGVRTLHHSSNNSAQVRSDVNSFFVCSAKQDRGSVNKRTNNVRTLHHSSNINAQVPSIVIFFVCSAKQDVGSVNKHTYSVKILHHSSNNSAQLLCSQIDVHLIKSGPGLSRISLPNTNLYLLLSRLQEHVSGSAPNTCVRN